MASSEFIYLTSWNPLCPSLWCYKPKMHFRQIWSSKFTNSYFLHPCCIILLSLAFRRAYSGTHWKMLTVNRIDSLEHLPNHFIDIWFWLFLYSTSWEELPIAQLHFHLLHCSCHQPYPLREFSQRLLLILNNCPHLQSDRKWCIGVCRFFWGGNSLWEGLFDRRQIHAGLSFEGLSGCWCTDLECFELWHQVLTVSFR